MHTAGHLRLRLGACRHRYQHERTRLEQRRTVQTVDLIRKTDPRRPIKIFLQDGENDLDNRLGNWFQNNERMASALAYAGYEYKFVAGKGMHSKRHGMALLPDILVWLWNDSPRPNSDK